MEDLEKAMPGHDLFFADEVEKHALPPQECVEWHELYR